MIGVYHPGASWLHRSPAAVKLAALAMGLSALAVLRSPTAVAVAVPLVLLAILSAGVPARTTWAQVRPVLWFALPVAAFQLVVADWRIAVTVAGSMVVAVAAAALVTLTTRMGDLLDTVVRMLGPARRLGVDPDRCGLVLALAVRSVPVVVGLWHEVAQARKARGAERSATALAVPFTVRALRHADRLGEALAARGVDD